MSLYDLFRANLSAQQLLAAIELAHTQVIGARDEVMPAIAAIPDALVQITEGVALARAWATETEDPVDDDLFGSKYYAEMADDFTKAIPGILSSLENMAAQLGRAEKGYRDVSVLTGSRAVTLADMGCLLMRDMNDPALGNINLTVGSFTGLQPGMSFDVHNGNANDAQTAIVAGQDNTVFTPSAGGAVIGTDQIMRVIYTGLHYGAGQGSGPAWLVYNYG